MSFALTGLTKAEKTSVIKDFTVRPKATQYNEKPTPIRCILEDKDTLYCPLGKWQDYIDVPKDTKGGSCRGWSPNGTNFALMNPKVKFCGELLTKETDPDQRGRDQNVIVETALKRLETIGTIFISVFTGGGKTAMAIFLSIKLGLKTLVMSHIDEVKKQWFTEYEKFTGKTIKIQYLTGPNVKLHSDADVYIVGVKKASTMTIEDFASIGTVIIDEAHIVTVTAFTESLLKFQPRYLIGLSATPNRTGDGLHSLLHLYFGPVEDFIVRKEKKDFTVYKYQTPFKPDVRFVIRKGKVVPDWCYIIGTIEEQPERWALIADIVLSHPKEKIIALCNRNILAKGVFELLRDKGEDVTLLITGVKKWNRDARVIIAGQRKAGVGFNDPRLTMGIICSDTQDVIQYEGRIRTTNNIIYHLVDNYGTFEKHWKKCKKWYIEKGATVKVVGISDPCYITKNNVNEMPHESMLNITVKEEDPESHVSVPEETEDL